MKKPRFRLDWPDDEEEEWDDDDEDLIDEEDGQCPEPEVEGPSYAPVFTGILKPDGSPILRHPLVIRMGFHPEDKKYYCPTLEENQFGEHGGKVFGWVYD